MIVGWNFKIDLTMIAPNNSVQILDDVVEDDSPGLIARKVFHNSMNALKDTIGSLGGRSIRQSGGTAGYGRENIDRRGRDIRADGD